MQEQGIAAADIKKLTDGGIFTVDAVAHAPKKELLAIKGLSEAKVEKLQQAGKPRPAAQQGRASATATTRPPRWSGCPLGAR